MIAPVMPGVIFLVLGGSLLEIENKLFHSFIEFTKANNKIERVKNLYSWFYTIYIPSLVTKWHNKREGREPVLTRRNVFTITYIAIGMTIFLVSGVLLTKSYAGLHLETNLSDLLNITPEAAVNLISALAVLPLMFIILAIVKKRQRTIVLIVIMVYILSLVLSIL